MLRELRLASDKKECLIDVTQDVEKVVQAAGVQEGLCCVYAPHTTCGIVINENYDPNVQMDILTLLKETVPAGRWSHDEVDGNADAHIKVAMVGSSETIPVRDGRLMLGQWQAVQLAEFDGPRKRTVVVKVI